MCGRDSRGAPAAISDQCQAILLSGTCWSRESQEAKRANLLAEHPGPAVAADFQSLVRGNSPAWIEGQTVPLSGAAR